MIRGIVARAVASFAAVLLSIPLAFGQSYPSDWYWHDLGYGGTNHQVWAGARGLFVEGGAGGGGDAAFKSWLLGLNTLPDLNTGLVATVTGTGIGTAGKIRITVPAGSIDTWFTGQYKALTGVGGTTEANDMWQITKIDSTHVDLDGSVFVHPWTSGGVIGMAPDISEASSTHAALYQTLNQVAISNFHPQSCVLASPPAANDTTPCVIQMFADVTLSNPPQQLYSLVVSASGKNLKLPQANLPNSIPIGASIQVVSDPCGGSTCYAVGVRDYLGGTIASIPTPGNSVFVTLLDKTTDIGVWAVTYGDQAPPSTYGFGQQWLQSTAFAASANYAVSWYDQTNHIFSFKRSFDNTTSTSVTPSAAPANNFGTGLNATGDLQYAQPTFANLGGNQSLAQLPTAMHGGYVAGRFYTGYMFSGGAGGTVALANNTVYYTPTVVVEAHTWTGISIGITATGTATLCRLAIYNSAAGIPSSLVIDGGTVSAAGTGTLTATVSQLLNPGRYWTAVVCNGTVTVASGGIGPQAWEAAGVSDMSAAAPNPMLNGALTFGAFPGTAGAPSYGNAGIPLVGLKG